MVRKNRNKDFDMSSVDMEMSRMEADNRRIVDGLQAEAGKAFHDEEFVSPRDMEL